MRKIYIKLASSFLAVIVALVMVGGVSYAWLTLSDNPSVSGIQVAIGGGNTILLAADMTKTVKDANGNDVVVHYPASFDETLYLSQYDTYDYLKELTALSPVSTADGVHWIMPVYDEETGVLRDISEFEVDSTLLCANSEGERGYYAYVDFWVVSPGADYELHVAMDTKTDAGSFLIELPEAVETDSGFTLGETSGRVASIARVGFLANDMVSDSVAMDAYSKSRDFDGRFSKLLGVYQEAGELPMIDSSVENFAIYEPNATLHPWAPEYEGDYILTRPLAYDELMGTITESDFSRVMVQENNTWRNDGENLWLEEIFQASVVGRNKLSTEETTAKFYQDYLDGQVAAYVSAGKFFPNTGILYDYAALGDGVVSDAILNQNILPVGATEDVSIISLYRNTPQRIRMFIWLEGQDADCTNTDAMTDVGFALGIELSGETK